jgi:hypothetical protein
MNYKLISLTLVLFALFVKANAQTDVFDEANSYKYAMYLYDTKEYSLAKEEFSRLNFHFPSNQIYQSKLLESCRWNKEINLGLTRAKSFYLSDSLFPSVVAKEFLQLMFLSEYRYRTEVFIGVNPTFDSADKLFYLGANYILDNKIDSTKSILSKYKGDSSQNISNLQTILISNDQFKPKNKIVAAGMSTLIPGLGKVYAGQWKDGAAVFLYTGLSAWQAYRGFESKGVKSIYGWLFASVGTGFYLGNIYGSVKLIKLRRQNHLNSIKQQTHNVLEASFK